VTAGRIALAGVALALAAASCRPSHPVAPAVADATGPAAGETATAAPPPPRGKEIVIAYSSNILGEYEPCG
jgi:hypothetical protein